MNPRIRIARARPPLVAAVVLFGVIVAWQIVETLAAPVRTVIPTPLAIAETIVVEFDTFTRHAMVTAQEAILGFILGCSVAIGFALLSVAIRPLEGAILRIGLALYAAPIIVIAPLLVLWLGPGIQTRVVVSALACFFVVLVSTIRGLKSVSEGAHELLYVLSASPARTFLKVRVHSALPYVFSALKVAAAAAVLGAIIGEWVGANEGLGVLLIYSLFQSDVARLWAGMVFVTVLALASFAGVGAIERIALPWHESVRRTRLELES